MACSGSVCSLFCGRFACSLLHTPCSHGWPDQSHSAKPAPAEALKHRSITGIYIRRTHLYNCTRKHLAMNIFVCLEIPPSMQASMRSACKEPARKVRIVIADVPEEKEKQNLHLRHKRHNHQHHLPWGTVATDMHRSPGLDHPTSFVPTGDPTRWPSPGQNPNFGDKGFVGDASNRSESVSRYITQSRSQC